jgi:hypothetical protein
MIILFSSPAAGLYESHNPLLKTQRAQSEIIFFLAGERPARKKHLDTSLIAGLIFAFPPLKEK